MSDEALSQYLVHWDILKIDTRDRLKGVGEISLEWPKTPWIDESYSIRLHEWAFEGIRFEFHVFVLVVKFTGVVARVVCQSWGLESLERIGVDPFSDKNYYSSRKKNTKHQNYVQCFSIACKPVKDCVPIKTMAGRQGQWAKNGASTEASQTKLNRYVHHSATVKPHCFVITLKSNGQFGR